MMNYIFCPGKCLKQSWDHFDILKLRQPDHMGGLYLRDRKNTIGSLAWLSEMLFCNPETLCVNVRNVTLYKNNIFFKEQIFFKKKIWAFSRKLEFFLNTLEFLLTRWKVSGYSEKFLDALESSWTIPKASGHSEKFLDTLKGYQILWTVSKYSAKVFGHSGQFMDALQSIQTI